MKCTDMQHRLELLNIIRDAGEKPSIEDRAKIEKKRANLAASISKFSDLASRFLKEVWVDVDDVPSKPIGIQEAYAESQTLPFPSTFSRADLEELGAVDLIQTELDLRKGWANDILHTLRQTVGNKSLNFQKGIRGAPAKSHMTRAWSNIRELEQQSEHLRCVYTINRNAMLTLGLPQNDQTGKYQSLKKEDLNASAAMAAPNLSGQSKTKLSWIWTVDLNPDAEHNVEHLQEC